MPTLDRPSSPAAAFGAAALVVASLVPAFGSGELLAAQKDNPPVVPVLKTLEPIEIRAENVHHTKDPKNQPLYDVMMSCASSLAYFQLYGGSPREFSLRRNNLIDRLDTTTSLLGSLQPSLESDSVLALMTLAQKTHAALGDSGSVVIEDPLNSPGISTERAKTLNLMYDEGDKKLRRDYPILYRSNSGMFWPPQAGAYDLVGRTRELLLHLADKL